MKLGIERSEDIKVDAKPFSTPMLITKEIKTTKEFFPSIEDGIRSKEHTVYKNLGKFYGFGVAGGASVLFGLTTIKQGFQEGNVDKIEAGAGFIGLGTFFVKTAYTAHKTIALAERQVHKFKEAAGKS